MKSIRSLYKIGYGPSSSHTIAPGSAARIFTEKYNQYSSFRVTLYGSLASTGKGHHTDEAILKSMEGKNVEIVWKPDVELPEHPNGLQFEVLDVDGVVDSWQVYSVGGGSLKDNGELLPVEDDVYDVKSMDELLEWCKSEGKAIWQYIDEKESSDIWDYLKDVWIAMRQSVENGLENEGVLPGHLKVARKASSYHVKAMNSGDMLRYTGLLFAYALAVSEENAAFGQVVTAPTCGACGVLPAALYFLMTEHNIPESKILRGLATAGMIGNIVKHNGSISGAEVGCQGEVGTACAMAAGAICHILGGTPAQVEYAAEMGFEHHLGLTCDPVGGYVQIPCIERNAFAVQKAREAAVFALYSDGIHKISFDQVVETMVQTGKDMQSKYRETSMGGLAWVWSQKK